MLCLYFLSSIKQDFCKMKLMHSDPVSGFCPDCIKRTVLSFLNCSFFSIDRYLLYLCAIGNIRQESQFCVFPFLVIETFHGRRQFHFIIQCPLNLPDQK